MRLRVGPTIVFCGLFGACSATPTVIPARNLERPGDMGFVCLAIDSDTGTLTGRPMRVCHPPGEKDPVIQPAGTSSRQLGTFALVTNTARGEMAAVDIDKGRLVDLDPGVFGFNMVPVGSMPESLAASADGCWVASANRDSCDLGLVDPSRLLASLLFSPAEPATGVGSPVTRVVPKTRSGRPLNAGPKEIVFLLSKVGLCQAEQAPPALVTFPSCDLVALLDMPSGTIKDSVFIRPDGVISAGDEPNCPADCAPSTVADAGTVVDDGEGAAAPADAGEADQGAVDVGTSSLLAVGALALLPDSSRVYVGASAADDFLTALDVVDGALVIPAGGGHIALEPGAIGIDHLRLSVDPFNPVSITLADGSVIDSQGSFLAGRGRFLYAFARDGSVRVVNVGVQPEQECDVNVEPDRAKLPANTGCFPVNPAARRPLAQGPGIRIPTLPVRTAAPPIARDIAVVDLPVTAAGIQKNPSTLSGQFAFLLASNDAVYILNLAPTTLADAQSTVVINEDNTLTHSFRELRATGQYTADTLALSSTPPLRTPVASDLLFPTTPILSSTSGPRLEEVENDSSAPARGNSINTTTNYWVNFPYQATYVSRAFTIAWEATLPSTARSSGTLQDQTTTGTSAGALDDVGADFCANGVVTGDLVVLPGCTADTDCSPQEFFTCHQPIGGATGLCLPKTAKQDLVDACARFMGSRRRYEVLAATPTHLTLGLHLDEVPKTAFNRVAATDTGNDAECQPTAAHRVSGTNPGFQWQQVWPGENFKRCVKACGRSPAGGATLQDADRDCRPGFVCEVIPSSLGPRLPGETGARYCVEAPPLALPPPLGLACWPQPSNRYHVSAGTSFLVSGSSLPDLKTTTVINGQCQLDPNRAPALANRIFLSAPACATIDGIVPVDSVTTDSTGKTRTDKTNTELALFGQATPGTPNPPYSPVAPPDPNPCLYQDFNYDEGATSSTPQKSTKAIFQNPQMRFVLTNLDQYGGDSLTTSLNLIGGFIPVTVALPSYEIALTQPIHIFTGPTILPDSPLMTDSTSQISYPYVYVLDQGRTALTPNSRGQIVRINARKGYSAVTTFDPAQSGTTPFQIQ